MFQLGQGTFGNSGYNTVTLENLRCTCQIETANLPSPPTAVLVVYGMTLDQMNSLSVAGQLFSHRNNLVTIQAGDDQSGLTTIFTGQITEAYPDGSDPPNVGFVVLSVAGAQIQIPSTNPNSFKGSASIDTVLKQIIQPAGLTLENNKVMATFVNPYFKGTVMEQIQTA